MKNHNYNPIKIKAGENLLEELGKNNLSFQENIAEAINNSIQAAIDNSIKVLDLYLEINYSFKNKNLNTICINDFSSGMDYYALENALRPGQAPREKKGLSEHGMGLNHLIPGIGKLEYIITKKREMDHAIKINDYHLEEIGVHPIDWDRECGTLIKIKIRPEVLPGDAGNFTKNINKILMWLGAKYRYYLKIDDADIPKNYIPKIVGNIPLQLNLFVKLNNLDEEKKEEKKAEKIKPIFPLYYHPATKENKPIIENIRFAADLNPGDVNKKDKDGNEILPFYWIYFCGGHAPPAEALSEGSKWGHPYGVKAGIDIFYNGIMIQHLVLKDLGIDLQKEGNSWGKLRGEIHIFGPDGTCPFGTTSAKNGIISDQYWGEFKKSFQDYLRNQGLYKTPAPINKEFEICDKICEHYSSMIGAPGCKIKEVIKGYRTDMPGYPVDITLVCSTDDSGLDELHCIEVKLDSAGISEVMQPLGYCFNNPKLQKKSILIAKSLNANGKNIIEKIKQETTGYEVEFHPLEKYGIKEE